MQVCQCSDVLISLNWIRAPDALLIIGRRQQVQEGKRTLPEIHVISNNTPLISINITYAITSAWCLKMKRTITIKRIFVQSFNVIILEGTCSNKKSSDGSLELEPFSARSTAHVKDVILIRRRSNDNKIIVIYFECVANYNLSK